jgi:hypothetical protein
MYLQGSACNSGPNYSSKFQFECDPKSGQVRGSAVKLTPQRTEKHECCSAVQQNGHDIVQ